MTDETDETDFLEDVADLAREHTEDAIAVLAEIMKNPDAPAGVRVTAAKALLERGWGKAGAPPQEEEPPERREWRIERVIINPQRPKDATDPPPPGYVWGESSQADESRARDEDANPAASTMIDSDFANPVWDG
jgi:hypothetical protein